MPSKASVLLLASLLLLAAACQKPQEPASPSASTSAPAASAASAPSPEPAAPAAAPAQPAGGAAPAEGVLASQDTNWTGVVAEVTEFRRKGNTLTAKVRLRNQGSGEPEVDIKYGEVYLMDLAAGKKYEVLRDEGGTYIAALRSGWTDRWYERLHAGQSVMLWMKFPAPPAEVKSVTLQIPGTPPFEDLAIQDS